MKPLRLDTELDDAIERFRNHRTLVNEEAQTCHMIEAAEAQAIIKANQELQERNEKGSSALVQSQYIILTAIMCSYEAGRATCSTMHDRWNEQTPGTEKCTIRKYWTMGI